MRNYKYVTVSYSRQKFGLIWRKVTTALCMREYYMYAQ